MNLQVIEGSQKLPPDYFRLYMRVFNRAANREPMDTMQIVYYAVRALAESNTSPEDAEILFGFFCAIKDLIAELTPNELLRLFPVEKIYDGHKYESKDYFTTMEVLRAHGMDTPLGESASDILWDYMNPHITEFVVHSMLCISNLRRLQGKPGLIEEFFSDIPMHTMHTDPATGKKYLVDGDTGETTRVITPMPRGWGVVKSGQMTGETQV